MSRIARVAVFAAILATAPATGGCTLVKPVVGAVAGPVILLANSNGSVGCGGDGRAILVVLAVAAAIGATGGLVTGVISDIQVLCCNPEDPTDNWCNPFAINTTCR